MDPVLTEYITLPRKVFGRRVGLSDTTVKKMIREGQIQSIWLSERKEMVIVQSYIDLLRQRAEKTGGQLVIDLKELGIL